ncbi:MAG: peptide chain release factor N(5)-glutamine methyltransferase [Flavobacteriales bacterium]|nr:peptide chain release factor N(5)-glutamine methyltransferase [Flavobacteriales bacterium]
MKKVSDILSFFLKELNGYYPEKEIKSLFYISIDHLLGYSKSDTIIKSENELLPDFKIEFSEIVERLQKKEPIQYILMETTFYGLPFFTRRGVLIPRPETEELVDWIIKDNENLEKRYLDIGTGSACIIISLTKNLNGSFYAIDVSPDALREAKQNVKRNNVDVNLEQFDILDSDLDGLWDVIVSNPPYVLESERKYMQQNVLAWEPKIALFVRDETPLLFYERIADQSTKVLNKNGILYFEINEKYGKETVDMLAQKGFVNIELKKDINDKDRMVKAMWK